MREKKKEIMSYRLTLTLRSNGFFKNDYFNFVLFVFIRQLFYEIIFEICEFLNSKIFFQFIRKKIYIHIFLPAARQGINNFRNNFSIVF